MTIRTRIRFWDDPRVVDRLARDTIESRCLDSEKKRKDPQRPEARWSKPDAYGVMRKLPDGP